MTLDFVCVYIAFFHDTWTQTKGGNLVGESQLSHHRGNIKNVLANIAKYVGFVLCGHFEIQELFEDRGTVCSVNFHV